MRKSREAGGGKSVKSECLHHKIVTPLAAEWK